MLKAHPTTKKCVMGFEHWPEMGIRNWASGIGQRGHWYQLFVIGSPKRVTNNKQQITTNKQLMTND
jgi:hypothetical protein